MIPHTKKPVVLKKFRSLARLEAELLREDILDLLHPIQAVLDLQVNLGPLKMVPNDSPYPKTWGLKKIRFLACLEAELLQEELRHLSRPFVVDFTDLADVGILLPNVFCVRLYQISLEHILKRENRRLCKPPPHEIHCAYV